MKHIEKRRSDRVKVDIDCLPNLSNFRSYLKIKNISETGILIDADEQIDFRGVILLEITIPHKNFRLKIHAKCVRNFYSEESKKWSYGFEFLDFSPAHFQIITENHDVIEANLIILKDESSDNFYFIMYPNYKTFDLFYNQNYSDIKSGIIFLNSIIDFEQINKIKFHMLNGQEFIFNCEILERVNLPELKGYKIQLFNFSPEDCELINNYLEASILYQIGDSTV